MNDTAPIEHPSWLTSGDFTAADEPFRLFAAWLKDATAAEPRDPTAMTLATVDADGMPNARMVLLKGADERGFVFYTNTESQKGRELAAQAKAALVFHWKSLNRQVRVRGTVEPVTAAEADAYFASRPKQAQIGAWASKQSAPLESRLASRRRSRFTPPNTSSVTCRGRRSGRATASCRSRSNSGTTGRSACTTASCFRART
jgi:pyridoxamine 5'-phosphate oxidase